MSSGYHHGRCTFELVAPTRLKSLSQGDQLSGCRITKTITQPRIILRSSTSSDSLLILSDLVAPLT